MLYSRMTFLFVLVSTVLAAPAPQGVVGNACALLGPDGVTPAFGQIIDNVCTALDG
jgi:hypothetical protein